MAGDVEGLPRSGPPVYCSYHLEPPTEPAEMAHWNSVLE